MAPTTEIRAAWLKLLLSTTPVDRGRAEAAVRHFYATAGLPEPHHVLWLESPCRAAWVVALLAAPHHVIWRQKLASSALSRDDVDQVERARATIAAQLETDDLGAALTLAGAPLGMHLQLPPDPARMLAPRFVEARYAIASDVSAMFVHHGDEDDLARTESHFRGSTRGVLTSELHCPTTGPLLGYSFAEDYSFSTMADDEARVGPREPPALLAAAWEVARTVGMWWAFEGAAIVTDRPSELHVNDRHLLHATEGPAVVYRDGWRVYAWNGKAVPARWILNPEAVPPREYKGFDPTFGAWAKSRTGSAQGPKAGPSQTTTPRPSRRRRAARSPIFDEELPADASARIERLRAHAGGVLPLFDRYTAGAHREVWHELLVLGDRVREDPHTADALAVASETMRRVHANVRTLVDRLDAIGYTFVADAAHRGRRSGGAQAGSARVDLTDLMAQLGASPHVPESSPLRGVLDRLSKMRDLLRSQKAGNRESQDVASPHVPPPSDIQQRIRTFERRFGTLPLSLRAFYEFVGQVNLMGHHPSVDPEGNEVCPDPLLVYALDDGIVEYDEEGEEENPSAVTIAPDDLHKANTSGGAPYEMAIPDRRADGELLNERHGVFFVEYLRVSFRFGGFPGYDGARIPPELAALAAGLIEF